MKTIPTYITINKEELEELNSGGSVEILVGKNMRRTLVVGNMLEVKKQELKKKFEEQMMALEAEYSRPMSQLEIDKAEAIMGTR